MAVYLKWNRVVRNEKKKKLNKHHAECFEQTKIDTEINKKKNLKKSQTIRYFLVDFVRGIRILCFVVKTFKWSEKIEENGNMFGAEYNNIMFKSCRFFSLFIFSAWMLLNVMGLVAYFRLYTQST